MKKLTKTAVVVASMAVMAMGATVMAGAATEGWVQSGSNWYYYVNGNKVSDQWVLAGDNWYFVDEEGRMVKDAFVRIDKYDGSSEVLKDEDIHASLGKDDIDDDSEFYYMNADGTMHKGWKEFKASNIYASPNSDAASKLWYYFGASGRMYVNEWVESSGEWYALSNNGVMYAEAVVNNNLINWDAKDNFYMNKNGAWVRGWYKTTATRAGSAPDSIVKEDAEKKKVFFDNKDKWVYSDPETGILAEREWKEIDGKYYFFGVAADNDTEKDQPLKLNTVFKVSSTNTNDEDMKKYVLTLEKTHPEQGFTVSSSSIVLINRDDNYDGRTEDKIKENAEKKAAMYSNIFVRWTNHSDKTEYFYLKKDGNALTTWQELDDDYWICGNSKGELYYDEVALINGKYYYFDEYGICDEKELNNTVDYIAVIAPESKEKDKDKEFHISTGAEGKVMYETTDKNDRDYIDISSMKKYLVDMLLDRSTLTQAQAEAKVYYKINSRKVSVKSMADNEVILAYTAKKYEEENNINIYDTEITVYKLRTSGKLSGKVSAPIY